MKKNIVILILLLVTSLFISGCLSDAQKQKEQELIAEYSDKFEEQAKLQYGTSAKVTDIKAATQLSDFLDAICTGDLFGDVTVDNQKFRALYLTAENKILSTRNYEKINKSMLEYYRRILGVNVFDGNCGRQGYGVHGVLAGTIETYEQFIQQDNTTAIMYTTDDISSITEKHFSELLKYLGSNNIKVKVVQVKKRKLFFGITETKAILELSYDGDDTQLDYTIK